ncbi:MAG TPA: PhzF family phenazine biosynthesis protein [Acidimicrobiales bacterium]
MSHPITVVDSFSEVPFTGNPAGVCLLTRPTTEAWMAAVAAELNLAETAFLVPRPDGDHDLRWFTPETEVELCGHATLASAHVLGVADGERRFHTRSGVLTCRAGDDGTIVMDFPAIQVAPVDAPPDFSDALGVGADRIVGVFAGAGWTLVEVAEPADVRAARPSPPDVEALAPDSAVLLAAAPGDRPGIDSVCRVFAPGYGIDEDPVTGSAHCVLAPWLAARAEAAGEAGRVAFVGEQASRRGGIVGMRLAGDRVELSGRAVTVIEGTLHSDPPAA